MFCTALQTWWCTWLFGRHLPLNAKCPAQMQPFFWHVVITVLKQGKAYMNVDFSSCLVIYIFVFSLEQDTYLIRETSFCQFSNMASSSLKKMFSQQFWTPSKVYGKMFFHNIFNYWCMIDVLSYMYQILLLFRLMLLHMYYGIFIWVGRCFSQLIIWFMTDVGWC